MGGSPIYQTKKRSGSRSKKRSTCELVRRLKFRAAFAALVATMSKTSLNFLILFSTGLNYTKKMLTTQCTALKKQCTIFHHYAHQSGFGVDARGVVYAPPSVLNAYYAAHAGSIQYANAPLPFYEDLMSLFGRKY